VPRPRERNPRSSNRVWRNSPAKRRYLQRKSRSRSPASREIYYDSSTTWEVVTSKKKGGSSRKSKAAASKARKRKSSHRDAVKNRQKRASGFCWKNLLEASAQRRARGTKNRQWKRVEKRNISQPPSMSRPKCPALGAKRRSGKRRTVCRQCTEPQSQHDGAGSGSG